MFTDAINGSAGVRRTLHKREKIVAAEQTATQYARPNMAGTNTSLGEIGRVRVFM